MVGRRLTARLGELSIKTAADLGAADGLKQVCRPGFACSQAEVLQLDPCQCSEYADDPCAPPRCKAPA